MVAEWLAQSLATPEDPGSSPGGGGFFRKRKIVYVWRRRVVFWVQSIYSKKQMLESATTDRGTILIVCTVT